MIYYLELFPLRNISIFSNYHENNEGLINRQINLELYASYVYTALAYNFDRSDVALKGKTKSNRVFYIDVLLFRALSIFQKNG
jgi:hypothetical protein